MLAVAIKERKRKCRIAAANLQRGPNQNAMLQKAANLFGVRAAISLSRVYSYDSKCTCPYSMCNPHLPNLLTEMENVITDDQNWYSKQPSQH